MNIFSYIWLRTKNNFISLSHADRDRCINCKYCCDDFDYKKGKSGYYCALSKCKFVTCKTKKYCYEYDDWAISDINLWFFDDETFTYDGKTYLKEKLLNKRISPEETYNLIQNMRKSSNGFFRDINKKSKFEKYFEKRDNCESKTSKLSQSFGTLRDYFYTNVGDEGANFVIFMFKLIFFAFYLIGRVFLLVYRLLLKVIKKTVSLFNQKNQLKNQYNVKPKAKKTIDFNLFNSAFSDEKDRNLLIKDAYFICPNCNSKLRTKNACVGKTIDVTCPLCRIQFRRKVE